MEKHCVLILTSFCLLVKVFLRRLRLSEKQKDSQAPDFASLESKLEPTKRKTPARAEIDRYAGAVFRRFFPLFTAFAQ